MDKERAGKLWACVGCASRTVLVEWRWVSGTRGVILRHMVRGLKYQTEESFWQERGSH